MAAAKSETEGKMKKLPKWAKIGLGITAGSAVVGGAYAAGRYQGKKVAIRSLGLENKALDLK